MKNILLIVSILLCTDIFAQGRFDVQGDLAPTGAYGIVKARNLRGGYLGSVYDTVQRNAIPLTYRDSNTLVFTRVDSTMWMLKGGIANSNWSVFSTGGSSLPSQIGNAGKFLTTDGTNPLWEQRDFMGIVAIEDPNTNSTIGVSSSNVNTPTSDEYVYLNLLKPSNNFYKTQIAIRDRGNDNMYFRATNNSGVYQSWYQVASREWISSQNYLPISSANSTFQRLDNLQSDLTASTTKYPSINAVNTGLGLKLNIGDTTDLLRKTSNALLTLNAPNLATTQDATKGILLQNSTTATSGVPVQISPATVFKGSVWNSGASGGGIATGANATEWKIENNSLSGNSEVNMDNYLDISMKWGSNSYSRIARFTKAGLETNLFQNTLTLGRPGNDGVLILNRSSGGSIGTIAGNASGVIINSNIIVTLGAASYIALGNGSPSFGSRYTPYFGLYLGSEANASATPLSRLTVMGGASIGQNVAAPTNGLRVLGNAIFDADVTAANIIRSGGTASQILAANGSVITAGSNIGISGGTISLNTSPSITTPTIITSMVAPAINGGTAANNSIAIQGTTNATRNTSYVNLQPNGGLVGVGTTTPLDYMHVSFNEGTGGQTGFAVQNTNASGASGLLYYNNTGALSVFQGYVNSTNELIFNNIAASAAVNFLTNSTTRLYLANSGNVGIGTASPNASAKVDVVSTTQGFLPPRMTTTQRDAIVSPAAGLTIYCTNCTANDSSTGVTQTYNGSTWKNYW